MEQPKRVIASRWTREDYDRRPKEFDPDIAQRILEMLENGEILDFICVQDRDFPLPGTFMRWVDQEPELSIQYAASMRRRSAVIFENAIAAAESGEWDAATRMRAAQHYAERMSPERFGRPSASVASQTPNTQAANDQPSSPDYFNELKKRIDAMAARAAASKELAK